MDRYSTNKKILDIIAKSIDENHDMCFIQILWALGIINKKDFLIEDRFYKESEETLQKIKQNQTELTNIPTNLNKM